MSTSPPRGPALVFTTPYLRKAPRRIALSTQALSLPGTYQLSRVVGGLVGALVLGIPGFVLVGVFGVWYPALAFATIGAIAGVGATTWKSSTGESAVQWALLFAAKRSGLVKVGGRWVHAYAGACRLSRAAFGPVRVVAASIEKLSVSEFHGDFIMAAPVRPKYRTPEARSADVPGAPTRRVSVAGQRAGDNFADSVSRAGSVFRTVRVASRHQRARRKRLESRSSMRPVVFAPRDVGRYSLRPPVAARDLEFATRP